MIQCPECSKDLADDAAHCGHCGAKLQEDAGMKTMFGFGAISPEMMKQAAQEVADAKAKAAATAGGVVDSIKGAIDDGDTIPTPALSLPEPHLPTPAAANIGMQESSSVFDLPVPGGAKKIDPFASSHDTASPTVQPGSVGSTPQGAGDPAWANQNIAPVATASAAAGVQKPMPSASPQGGLSAPANSQMDWNGAGGPVKEKSKTPMYVIGGCLLFFILMFVGFVVVSFVLPMILG